MTLLCDDLWQSEMISWQVPLTLVVLAVVSVYCLLSVLADKLRCRLRRRHGQNMTPEDTSDACLMCCRPSEKTRQVIDRYQRSALATEPSSTHSSSATRQQHHYHHHQRQQQHPQHPGAVSLLVSL